MSLEKSTSPKRSRLGLLVDRVMALVILVNVGLVVFDLTYVKARPVYLRAQSYWTRSRQTRQKDYVKTVAALEQELKKGGLQLPKVEVLLQELRQKSIEILFEDPPFEVTDSKGSLATIRQKFASSVGTEDAKQAVEIFWSREYLVAKGWQSQLAFFNREIRFLFLFNEPGLNYDFIKGIEPYRDTTGYLKKVAKLKAILAEQGMSDPEVDTLLQELRDRSNKLLDSDYFQLSQQTGTMSLIKDRMKQHIYEREPKSEVKLTERIELLDSLGVLEYLAPEVLWAEKSSKQAFNSFWTRKNLETAGWQKELAFFEREIQGLMRQIYYRHMGYNNEYIDRFWLLDLPWLVLFWVWFLLRTGAIARRSHISWWSAMKQRWYDLFLLQPWVPLLRIITAVIRLERAKLPSLEQIRNRIGVGLIANYAQEITQTVISRGIDQLQGSVRSGSIKRAVLKRDQKPKRSYIDINDTDEMQAISSRLLQITTCKVLPEVHADLQAFLEYQVKKAMHQTAIYKQLQRLPLLGRLPNQIADNLVGQISKAIAQSPQKAYIGSQTKIPDPAADKLKERLVGNLINTLRSELQQGETIDEIEALLVDWLEEFKINYVKGTYDPALQPSYKPAAKQIMPAKEDG
ncbi:MAG: hypothetical protein AB4352_00665 [Hormoscilla sp.]